MTAIVHRVRRVQIRASTITETGELFLLHQRIRRKMVAVGALELMAQALEAEALEYAMQARKLRRQIRELRLRALRARFARLFSSGPRITENGATNR